MDDKGKKIRMSAHQYVEIVIVSVEKLVTDEAMFPTKYGMLFFVMVLLEIVINEWINKILMNVLINELYLLFNKWIISIQYYQCHLCTTNSS